MLFFTCVLSISAHDFKGKVVTTEKQPIEDVAIYNQDTGKHTHTDESGNFILTDVRENDKISISSLGYQTKLIVISKEYLDNDITIELKEASVSLKQVVLSSEINSLNQIIDVDIQNSPVKSSQEILQKVPGLIIGQHAGGGKAEQIFLRGFDVDHGTDVAVNVDGMPVNMVSHAHGQGYADLHFVIPETIEGLDFGKGPYYAEQGNFNTAGYVNLKLKESIKENMISAEVGQYNTTRTVGMFKLLSSEKSNAYLGWTDNWGNTKGLDDFEDVCIVLNPPTLKAYKEGKLNTLASSTANKLYVACTRAKGNVYFVPENMLSVFKC